MSTALVGDGTPHTETVPVDGSQSASYTLPLAGVLVVESVVVEVSNGGSSTRPVLRLLDKSGQVIAEKPAGGIVLGGDDASLTWALRLADDGEQAAPTGIQEIESTLGSIGGTPTFGPVADLFTKAFTENLSSGTVTIAAGGTQNLGFTHQDGDTLLNAALLRPLAKGIYYISGRFTCLNAPPGTPGSSFNYAIVPGSSLFNPAGLTFFPGAGPAHQQATIGTPALGLPATSIIVQIINTDTIAHDYQVSLSVALIGRHS